MNKCWKFQEDILILVWFRAERLKICCNKWTPVVHYHQKWTAGVHLLQQIFAYIAINQTKIKISSWNFQHLFIRSLCKFDKKFWPKLKQPACHGPFQPKLWMSLATVFVEISQKEKSWWGSGPIWVPSWKEFQISSKKWRFEIFRTSAPSRYFTMSTASWPVLV